MTDDDAPARAGPTCPLCDEPLFDRHCKYVCPQHGVVVDCSDPFFL
ncbi:HVO_2523 family zinc finger protein [Haloarchaeobius sp. HRN-SO-5]